MKGSIISALLVAGSYAMPAVLQKRAIFTDEVVVTVWTTTTIYSDPTDLPAAFAEEHSSVVPTPSSLPPSSLPLPPSSSAAPPPSSAPPVVVPSSAPAPVVSVPAPVKAPAVVTPVDTPTPTPTPAPAPASGDAILSGSGQMTFYDVSVGRTSCGGLYSNSDNVVALSHYDMNNGANSNDNSLCGKTISITYNGVTASGTVVDTCAGCDEGNIDLSEDFFPTFAPASAGRVSGVTWRVQ